MKRKLIYITNYFISFLGYLTILSYLRQQLNLTLTVAMREREKVLSKQHFFKVRRSFWNNFM